MILRHPAEGRLVEGPWNAGPGSGEDRANDEEATDRERALGYLRLLNEDTMVAAWGAHREPGERRRIAQAAVILGRKLEEKLAQRQDELRPDEAQRFLMALINATVTEFASQENLDSDAATEFLSDVGTRDLVLEFNEALEASEETGLALDDQLRRIVEDREDRAIWSDHWSSG